MIFGITLKGYSLAQKSIFELDLVRIAKWHRRCAILAGVMIVIWILNILLNINHIFMPELISVGLGAILLVSVVVSIVFVIALRRAMGSNIASLVLYGLITIFFNIIVLLAVASSAGIILRLAGVKTGFFGVPPDDWDKLRPGHCRGCGYSRESLEILQECPECRRVPQVI